MSEKKLCRSVFAVRREWDKDATRDETFKHFGYENVHAPKHGTGCWANDGETIPRNIQELPEALELIVEPNEKLSGSYSTTTRTFREHCFNACAGRRMRSRSQNRSIRAPRRDELG